MILNEQIDILCEIILNYVNERKVAVLSFDKNDKTAYEHRIQDNGINIELWINGIENELKNNDLLYHTIAKKSKEYYVVVLKNYDTNIEKWFKENGYKNPFDFIFLRPQQTILTGSNIRLYCDDYKNRIVNIPNDLQIILRGYANTIEFGERVIFAGGGGS